jgi:hypothetical protein
MKVEYLTVEDIHIHDEIEQFVRELVTSEYAGLQADVRQNGIRDPLTVSVRVRDGKEETVLIDGHHRLEIAKRLGIQRVPVERRTMVKVERDEVRGEIGKRECRQVKRDLTDDSDTVEGRTTEDIRREWLAAAKAEVCKIQAHERRNLNDFGLIDLEYRALRAERNSSLQNEGRNKGRKYEIVANRTGFAPTMCERAIFIIDVANGWDKPGTDYAARRKDAQKYVAELGARKKEDDQKLSISGVWKALRAEQKAEEDTVNASLKEDKLLGSMPKTLERFTELSYDAVAIRAAALDEADKAEVHRNARLAMDWLAHFCRALDEGLEEVAA